MSTMEPRHRKKLNIFHTIFDDDKKYVTEEFCNKYLKKPLEYAIKNKDNFAKKL